MQSPAHAPIVVATRNTYVERIHWGSLAAVDATGALVAHVGDPDTYPNSCIQNAGSSALLRR